MKKTISILLTLSIIVSLAFSSTTVSADTILSADTDGVFWIEESDAEVVCGTGESNYVLSQRVGTSGTPQSLVDSMSGKNAHWLKSSGATYVATYKVNVSEAGTYKLWYRGSDPSNGYHDKSKIKVNGTEVTVSKITGTDFTATIDPAGTKKNYACAWFVAEVNLTAGENTIIYDVTEQATSDSKYAFLFDCMVLAPSTYEWASPSVDTRPKTSVISFANDGIAWIEESDNAGLDFGKDGMLAINYDVRARGEAGENGTTVAIADSMSGGNAHWLASSGYSYTATYKVKAPEAGTYKLWYRGSDPTNSVHDKSKIKVNGTEVSITKITGTDFGVTMDPNSAKNYACAWFVAEVTLTGGVDIITYEVLEKSSGASNRRMLFDCFVLAPSNYEWTNPSISTRPKTDAISFAEDGVAWIEESDNAGLDFGKDGMLAINYDVRARGEAGENGTTVAIADSMSGGNAHWLASGGYSYTATYNVKAPEAGTYKLWYRGSDPTNSVHDKSKIKVNGTEVSITKITGTDFGVTMDPNSAKNYACAWFVAEVTLTGGVDTITYEVLEKSSGASNRRMLFDCFVLAPSNYEWTKPTIDTKPTEPQIKAVEFDEDGVAWIEESDNAGLDFHKADMLLTNYDIRARGEAGTSAEANIAIADSMSGGNGHWLQSGGYKYTATYNVKAPEAGTYKLWYRGSDPTNGYHDKSKIYVNGTEVSITKVTGTDFTVSIDGSKNYACGWFVAEVALTGGIDVITYEVLETSTNASSQHRMIFDCFVLAPSKYEWTDIGITTKPAEPQIKAVEFNEDGVAWIEESDNAGLDFHKADMLLTNYDIRARGEAGTSAEANIAIANSMSGGNGHWLQSGGFKYTATYNVKAPEAGTYKLWYRGSDPSNGYHDKSKIYVNGTEVSITKVTGTDFTIKIDGSKTYACGWFVTEVTLTGGVDTIIYEVLETSTSASTQHRMLFDCFVLAPSNYEWTDIGINTRPAKVVLKNYGWIEGENYTAVSNTSYFMARAFAADDISEGKALVLNTTSAPNGETGSHYADYTLRVGKDATYDIFVRSNHTSGSNANSPIIISVDGMTYAHTEFDFEGWIKPNSGSDQFTVGWSKITLPLTTGNHTLRWEVKDMGSSKYFGIVDAVVFMPSSMKFTPKTHDIIGTKAEYELSALLSDYDLSSVTENISLPTETMSGSAVTWTTSDASAITNQGVVTRNEYYNMAVTLTANITGNHKGFEVIVARSEAYDVKNFTISGSKGNGSTVTASANVTSLLNDRNMVIIIAHYDAENNIKGYDFGTYSLTKNSSVNASASITLNNFASGDFVKAYIWNDLDNIDPIADSIESR